MKSRRALSFPLTVVLALCAFGGLWLYKTQQQHARNRQLIDALTHNDTETALTLVNEGADPNTPTAAPPVFTLPRLLDYLLHRPPPPVYDDGKDTAFTLACNPRWMRPNDAIKNQIYIQENPRLVEAMLTHGADVHIRVSNKDTMLHTAIQWHRLQTLELLLQHGADVNAQNGNGDTPLMRAIAIRNAAMVDQLLQHGADVNIQNEIGESPLMGATQMDSDKVVSQLLQHGANPNLQNDVGFTAMHIAIYASKSKSIIPDLFAHGANGNLCNKSGLTPFQLAQQVDLPEIMRLLKDGTK